MKAPTKDPDGRRALIKFARKTKEHYVMTELEKGKASGWRADYIDGQWVEDYKPKKAATKKKTTKKKKAAGG